MYEEQMNELAAQYVKQHIRPFKTVAEHIRMAFRMR